MKPRALAVIDIGSNTIRSLIVEPVSSGGYKVLDDEREVARLAAGLDRNGRLSRPAMDRAVDALRRMSEIARARGAGRVAVVATSAIRNAANQRTFVSRVRRETGLTVRVVSGQEEARLAFESAAACFDLGGSPCAVVDVGGGSTELILALGGHMQHLYSLALGAVALTEKHLRSDPVRRREFKAMRAEVRDGLEAARIVAEPHPQFLIASGGTASSIAQVCLGIQGLSGRPAHGFETTQAELLHLREALLRRSLGQRRQMPGLAPDRADIIVAGVSILYEIMAHLHVNQMRVSARGIRHALLSRLVAGSPLARQSSAPRPHRLESAATFARSLRFEQKHGEQVQRIALSMFDQLSGPLHLDMEHRDLLAAAALLHDIGYVVGFKQHHKHSYHLIANAQLDGFTPSEREIIALVARYHRRSHPRKKHESWGRLRRTDRQTVARLSALLRVADSLDRRHTQGLTDIKCRVTRGCLKITLESTHDLGVEIHAALQKSGLLQEVFGVRLGFESARSARRRRPRPALGPQLSRRRVSA